MNGVVYGRAPEMEGFKGLLHFARDPLGAMVGARQHGSLVSYSNPAGEVLLVFDAELIEALLHRSADSVHKDIYTRELRSILGGGLLTNENPSWRAQRKLLAPSFQPRQIQSYAEGMVASTERLAATFESGKPRDLHADMMHLTLEIVVQSLFGSQVVRTQEVESLLELAVDDYRRLMMSWRAAFPWFPFLSRLRFRGTRSRLRRVIFELIEDRKTKPLGDDMLSRLLLARDEEGGSMSEEQLLDEAITMLLAGHETTALTLTFTLDLLAKNPSELSLLHQELDRQLNGRPPSLNDYPELKRTRAVVKESLRLFPPAWAMGREAIADFQLGDYPVKKGTQIVVCPWVSHREPSHFLDPEAFRPERWMQEEAAKLPRGAYFPFGLGPRTCIGHHFAEMEAALVLATLLSQYRFVKTEDGPLPLSPSVTLRPKYPVIFQVERRSAGETTAL